MKNYKMASIMRSLIIMVICIQSTSALFGFNIHPKLSKNIQLFNDEPIIQNRQELNESVVYYNEDNTVATEIYDDDENCTSNEEEIDEPKPDVIPQNDIVELVNIQLTPEEYKEYFVAVSERRKRIWEEQYGPIK